MSSRAIFENTETFRTAFVNGLEEVLDNDGLGVFILVLANASYDASIYQALQSRLQTRYMELVDAFRQGLDDAPDDMQVFDRLMSVGLENLHCREYRQLGPWRVQFNQLRSFRPARMSDKRVDSLSRQFDIAGFHFNKHFLQKEILWEGQMQGSHCRLLFNKFPFADHHCIWVIEPQESRPQFISREAHEYIWQLCELLAAGMPGLGFGYNANGAAASVNHQHFQMYVRDDAGYPVELDYWQHNGGTDRYPLDCGRYDDCELAWQRIESLHASNTAYNLLYRPGLVYVLPRRMQGHFSYADWMAGMGWTDVAGDVTVFTRESYEQLGRKQLEGQLRNAALSSADLV